MYCKLSKLRRDLDANDVRNSDLVDYIIDASAWVDSLYPRISPFGGMVPIEDDVDALVAGDAFAVPDTDPQATSGFDVVRATGAVEGRVVHLLAAPKYAHQAYETIFFENYSVQQNRDVGSYGSGGFFGQDNARHLQLKNDIDSSSRSLELFDNGVVIPPIIRAGTQILLGPPPLIQRACLLYAMYLGSSSKLNRRDNIESTRIRRFLFEAEEFLMVKKHSANNVSSSAKEGDMSVSESFPQTGIATARPHPLISISRQSQRIVL